jgi:response regulator RpfG family c-di-GMP phosphodiesterase
MRTYEILLAQSDENPYHPSILRWTLEAKGYQVKAVLGNDPAIEILGKKNFDLVITDLLGVLERAREVNPEGMTILMLTTQNRSVLGVHAVRSAADGFIFVPFELTELELRVQDCVNKLEHQRNAVSFESQDRLNDKISETLRILSYDVKGSLLSMAVTLKLLAQDHGGKMDGDLMNTLNRLFSRTVGLIEITDECLGEIASMNGDMKKEDGMSGWIPDVVYPVLKEFFSEAKQDRAA